MNDKPYHNYQIKLARLIAAGKLPTGTGIAQLDVFHDDWCGIYKGGRCNCDPEIKPHKATKP